MNARIKKDDLASFKTYASQIRKNTDQPITDYLKIEVIGDFISVTKTNYKAFAIQTTPNDSEDCCFLVDENILFNFVELSDSEFINFTITGIRITIFDDRNKAVSQTENVSMYPKVDVTNKEWVTAPKYILDAVGICAQIVFDDEISGIKNSVFIGQKYVAGSDATIGYWQQIKEDLPNLVLRKEVAMAVSKLNGCDISSNDSYDLFKQGNVLFGFVKSVIGFVCLPPKFEETDRDLSFYINKSALIKWNSFCINSCKSKVLTAEFNADGNKLNLELIDSKYERNNNSYLDVANGSGSFTFNPVTLNTLLKVLPNEQLHFYPGRKNDRYYITDKDKTFMSAIMLIQK